MSKEKTSMTRSQALRELMYEAQRERRTKIGLKRIRQAGKLLQLTDAEQVEVEQFLDYRNSDGHLYASVALVVRKA